MKAVNLLPSEHRGSAKPVAAVAAKKPEKGAAPFGAYIVLGLLAFAVAASGLTALAKNTIKERKSELAQVTAQAEATSAKASSLQSYADFGGLAQQRVSTVKGLASARFNWELTMADLAKALPADVHLRSLNGSASASGTNATGVATVASPTIQLTGCTTTQTAVADLMSRLRNVRGVTRVSLTGSIKQPTAEVVAPATDGSRAASLCPKGSPPEFDVTMYFERAQASAMTAVNPTAATATATTPTSTTGAAATATPATGAAATPAAGTTADSGTTTASTTTTTSTGTTK